MSQKVIVGVSGGVDSSVSALLLKQQDYDVSGVFMKNWDEENDAGDCPASIDLADAEAVCKKLDIPLHAINFETEYWDNVFAHFLKEYKAGRTPNPDILCNQEIKFKAFLEYAGFLGADFIATGHYVRKRESEGQFQLLKGLDANKDQSYFLYTLGQAQLAKSLFPIGELEKPLVRDMAEQAGFINHAKKDSTGICFIGERKFKDFLQQYLPAQPGEIQTPEGTVIGQHDGLMYHTLGQRQGLNIGGRKDAKQAPWYVAKKDLERNVLIAVQDTNHPLLMSTELTAEQLCWVAGTPPANQFTARAKTRYRQADQACRVTVSGESIQVEFEQPQRAVTPGQSVVLYQEDACLGGGVII